MMQYIFNANGGIYDNDEIIPDTVVMKASLKKF